MIRQRDYLAVSPAEVLSLPQDAARLLAQPDMFSTTPQQLHERPTVAFLDHIQNCAINSANMKKAAFAAFNGRSAIFSQTTMMIGAPGLNKLYLPSSLGSLQSLASLAGASAQLAGDLGNKYIMMEINHGPRPASTSAWHEDAGKTYLLCSEKVSSVLALENAAKNESGIHISANTALFSPLKGMPVSFKTILHTKPYEMCSDDEAPATKPEHPPCSSMLVIYEFNPAVKQPQAQYVAAQPRYNHIYHLTGAHPKKWGFD